MFISEQFEQMFKLAVTIDFNYVKKKGIAHRRECQQNQSAQKFEQRALIFKWTNTNKLENRKTYNCNRTNNEPGVTAHRLADHSFVFLFCQTTIEYLFAFEEKDAQKRHTEYEATKK